MTTVSPTALGLWNTAFDAELTQVAETGVPASQWNVAGKGRKKALPEGEDGNWWRAEGPKMVQRWIDWRRQSKWLVWTTPDDLPAIELPLDVEIPGSDYVLRMVIDRIMTRPPHHQNAVIVDLKSGSRQPDSDLQLAVYRFGILQQYGVDVGRGAYWNARSGEMSEVYPLARYTPELIALWFRRFIETKERGLFIPHPTFRCRACSVRKYCVAYGGSESHLDPDHKEAQT